MSCPYFISRAQTKLHIDDRMSRVCREKDGGGKYLTKPLLRKTSVQLLDTCHEAAEKAERCSAYHAEQRFAFYYTLIPYDRCHKLFFYCCLTDTHLWPSAHWASRAISPDARK